MAFAVPLMIPLLTGAGAASAAGAAGGIGAFGALLQGVQAKNAADYNAKVDENNAILAEQQANAREEAYRVDARKELGRQRAAFAESGLGLSGSTLDIANDSALAAEMDALNIRYGGTLQAQGLREQAKMSRFQGRQQLANAGVQAVGSILGGVAKGYGG